MKLLTLALSLAIIFGGFSFITHQVQADQERSWIPLATNQTFTGGSSSYLYKGLVYCEPKDMLYFTWKAGDQSGNQFYYLDFFTTTQCFNWSDGGVEYSPIQTAKGAPEGDLNRYVIEYSMTTGSAWVRPCANDVVMVSITSPYAMTEQTFNITITKDTNTVDGKILQLESRLDALEKSVSENLTALKNLTASLNTSLIQNISLVSNNSVALDQSLRENLSVLSSEIINLSSSSDFSELLEQINATNDLLAQSSDANNQSVLDLMGDINELRARLSSLASYNDSEIRSELARLSAIEPVNEFNNITVVNQTVVNQTLVNQTNTTAVYPATTVYNHTYLNKTIDSVDGFAPAVAGVIGGFIGALIAILTMMPLKRKRHQHVVAAPAPVPPPEAMTTSLLSTRRLQQEEAEGEIEGFEEVL